MGVEYICGRCGKTVVLDLSDTTAEIRCTCGYRILYKKRTKQVVQLEGR